MLFYGDVERTALPSSVRDGIADKIRQILGMAPGRERHEALVRAFIEAGELVQGIADQAFERAGADDVSEIQDAALQLLLELADAVKASWQSGFSGDLGAPKHRWEQLDQPDGLPLVRLKRGEGYAFYCLYPESYLEAASRSGLSSDTVAIGLRSIGTGLAALVAAALGTRRVFTLRPVGHPFDRHVAVTPALTEKILEDRSADFAVADEGPGLSGSSFGCVADWLIGHGVPPDRIHFFPSHGGKPGHRASSSHKARWEMQPRHVTGFDEVLLRDRPGGSLLDWASGLVGGRARKWEDVSGGGWRAHHYPSENSWPAVHASMERRKFLMRADDRTWLVRFAGIDELADRRLKAGAALAEAGLVPRPTGSAYGFLVEEWLAAKPVDASISNDEVIDPLGRYLGFRAAHLPAHLGGASLSALCSMAIFNTEKALGAVAAETLRKRIGDTRPIERRLRRIDTDNRPHRWEWLVTTAGDLLKTDAIDHNAAHDLVGCQDIAWDIAGAAVEFELSGKERTSLAERVAAQSDVEPRDETLCMFEYCYLAFQIGLWTHARWAADGNEALRIEATLKRYVDRMSMLLLP